MASSAPAASVTHFSNCRLVLGDELVDGDLWIDSTTGKIIEPQDAGAGVEIDLDGRILAPGLIEIQLNGAMGFNYSDVPDTDEGLKVYAQKYRESNKGLIKTGVTSFLPTITTNKPQAFQMALPLLASSGHLRDATLGTESLGAHCEGPFISASKKGAHAESYLLPLTHGLASLEACYGASNLSYTKLITLAPELPGAMAAIRDLRAKTSGGTVVAIGHTAGTYDTALGALDAGATCMTHLFNAMPALHHREPGVLGAILRPVDSVSKMLATAKELPPGAGGRPYFGIIADGIHVHPTCVRLAWEAHPKGCILTTDGTWATGLEMPDGVYEWSSTGRRVEKKGRKLVLEGTDTIAGGTSILIECVSNLIRWTGASIGAALQTVTSTPAKMIGCADTKGVLKVGADADLIVLRKEEAQEGWELRVDQVWKFGVSVSKKQ